MIIADIINNLRNNKYIMMHKNCGTKYLCIDELEDYEKIINLIILR